jgi:hypothetical protein
MFSEGDLSRHLFRGMHLFFLGSSSLSRAACQAYEQYLCPDLQVSQRSTLTLLIRVRPPAPSVYECNVASAGCLRPKAEFTRASGRGLRRVKNIVQDAKGMCKKTILSSRAAFRTDERDPHNTGKTHKTSFLPFFASLATLREIFVAVMRSTLSLAAKT